MRALELSTLIPLAFGLALAIGQSASAGEDQVAPVVTATRVTVRQTRAPGPTPFHLPGPIVERLLVDYELAGGTYSQPPLVPGSQAFMRVYLQDWGPTGVFTSELNRLGDVELSRPSLSPGNQRVRFKAGKVVAYQVTSSMKAAPVQQAGGGFRWQISYRIVINGHPYRVEIDAVSEPSLAKPSQVDVVAHFTGPFRAPAKKAAPGEKPAKQD
jgi:hypothetical protein